MAIQLDTFNVFHSAGFRKFHDQYIVRTVCGGFAGPHFAISRPKCNSDVRRGARPDFADLGAGGSVQHQHPAPVENSQQMFPRIHGDVHGPAFDQRLLAPRAQQLIGGQQIKSAGLLAERDGALQ